MLKNHKLWFKRLMIHDVKGKTGIKYSMMRKTVPFKVINFLTLFYSDAFYVMKLMIQYIIMFLHRWGFWDAMKMVPDEGDGTPPMTLISALAQGAGSRSRSPFMEEPIHSPLLSVTLRCDSSITTIFSTWLF